MQFAHILITKQNAALIIAFKSRNDAQQRRLAGTGWSQQGRQLAFGNLQIHVMQRLKVAEELVYPFNSDGHAPVLSLGVSTVSRL